MITAHDAIDASSSAASTSFTIGLAAHTNCRTDRSLFI